jgi:glycosyltransferase involved in cell wall biosynthesis
VRALSVAAADRFEFVAVCPEGELARQLEWAGVQVRRLSLQRLLRRPNPLYFCQWLVAWAVTVRHLARLIQREGVHLVHSNSTEAHLYAAPAARLAHVPCIWHARDLRSLSGLGKWLGKLSTRVIAISDAVASHLTQERVPSERIRRIYNGIDVAALRHEASAVANLPGPGRRRWVVMVGQLVPWKRHADFIAAMALIAPHFSDVRGLIVGSDLFGDHPNYRRELETLCAQTGVADRITLLGQRNDTPSIIAASEMLVMPSEAEPFGRAALEAMALGKPVVGTRAGGLPELVEDGETGLLVGVHRPEELAQAIERLLLDPARAREMGRRGAERAQLFFDAGASAAEVRRLYEEVLEQPATSDRLEQEEEETQRGTRTRNEDRD